MSDREEFEKWCRDTWISVNLEYYPKSDCYEEDCVDNAWDGWKASFASMQAKLDALEAENARLKEVAKNLERENARFHNALQQLAKLGNGDLYGNSIGNQIARDALKDE